METKIKTTRLCKNCIDAIRSRGESVFVGSESESEDLDGTCTCEFCEEADITYDCIF